MATELFLRNNDIQNQIVLLGGEEVDGFDPAGAAITTAPLREATAPTEGTGGYLCQGSAASESHILTFRVLRGSAGFRRLQRAVADQEPRRLSIRPRL